MLGGEVLEFRIRKHASMSVSVFRCTNAAVEYHAARKS